MSYQYATRNYYNDERNIFAEAYSIRLTDEEAKKILKKLNTHCERLMKKEKLVWLKKAYLSFRGHRDSGNCSRSGKIRIAHNPSMGVLIHEFAHHAHYYGAFRKVYQFIPNKGTTHHGLHFDIVLSQLHVYAKSKGYWKGKIFSEMFIAAAKKAYDEAPIPAVERLVNDPVFNELVKNGGKVDEIPEDMFKPVVPEGVATLNQVKEVKEILDIAAGV